MQFDESFPTNEYHPVWIVYDLYKTARLNVKYYAARLTTLERYNLWMDISIAVAAPASAISGIWLLKTEVGQEMWKYFGGTAAIVSVLKPLFKLATKIKSTEQCLSGYRALEFDIEQIVNKIRTDGCYSKAAQQMLSEAQRKKKILVCNPPENTQDKKLIERAFVEINRENPYESFFVPEVIE